MSTDTDKKDRKKKKRRRALYAAIIGALLALGCEYAPSDYQVFCEAVSKIVPLVCGIGG